MKYKIIKIALQDYLLYCSRLAMRSTIFVILLFCTTTIQAQVRSLKLGVGPELSMNWLVPDEADQKMGIGGGININYSAFPYFGIGVGFGYNELNGMRWESMGNTEQGDMLGKVTFKTSSWHLGLNMKYNMLPNSKVNPFLSAGIGLLYFDPKYDNGKPLPNAVAGNYQKWAAMIPVSVGVNFFFAEEFSVNLTGEYNITMSDFLDDIKVGSADKYFSVKLGFSYYFFDKFYILWERNRK